MVSESVWEDLNRSYGYEITLILLSGPFSRNEIREKIPHEFSQTMVERVLEWGYDNSIFGVAGTRGVDKYFTNKDEFSEDQIEALNRRALVRLMDPIKSKEKPTSLEDLPDELFYAYDRSEVEEVTNGLIFDKSTPEKTDIHESYYDDVAQDAQNNTTPRPYDHINVARLESRYHRGLDLKSDDEE